MFAARTADDTQNTFCGICESQFDVTDKDTQV
jgi:hypothetical protein